MVQRKAIYIYNFPTYIHHTIITFKHTPNVGDHPEYGFRGKDVCDGRKFKCKLRKIVLHRFCESLIYFYFSSLYFAFEMALYCG